MTRSNRLVRKKSKTGWSRPVSFLSVCQVLIGNSQGLRRRFDLTVCDTALTIFYSALFSELFVRLAEQVNKQL